MIKLPWSIHSRIAHAFLIVTLFIAAAHTGAFVYHWGRFNDLGLQISGWQISVHLAEQLSPLFENEPDKKKIREAFADYTFVNPGAEPYLIDSKGRILVSRYQPNNIWPVDMEPVHEFLAQEGFPTEPIYGTQPWGTHHEPVPFSVAPVTVHGEKGYLYIVLESAHSRVVSRSVGDNAVLQLSIWFYVSALIGGGSIGLGLLYMLSRRFKHLTGIVQEFKEGDYRRRAEIPSRDELGMYASTFNEMADQIEEQVQRLESTDRTRRELVAGVSHDLRAPLTRVRANIETARMELSEGAAEEGLQALERSLLACDALNELLDDLFELSKLDADGFVANVEEFSIDELLDGLLMRLQSTADESGISLRLEAAEGLPLVVGDLRLVSRAVSNLIENAIAYTKEGGSVVIAATQKQTSPEITVSISDTGVGIPEGELPHIFDRFFRASTTTKDGSGLGLAIAQRSMAVQGSRLHVKSEVGMGTTFSFSLPLSAEQ